MITTGGQVVGVASARVIGDASEPIQGVGSAISSNQLVEALPSLMAGGMILLGPDASDGDTEVAGEDPVDTSGWLTYVNGLTGYSFSYPPGWVIDDEDLNEVLFESPDLALRFVVWVFDTWTADYQVFMSTLVDQRRDETPGVEVLEQGPTNSASGDEGEFILFRNPEKDGFCEFIRAEFIVIGSIDTFQPSGNNCTDASDSEVAVWSAVFSSFDVPDSAFVAATAGYTNPKYGYSLTLPRSWDVDAANLNAVTVDADEQETTAAEIYLWTFPDSFGLTIDDWLDQTIEFRRSKATFGFNIIGQANVDWIPGVDARLVQYERGGARNSVTLM